MTPRHQTSNGESAGRTGGTILHAIDFQQYQLSNGLRVILHRNDHAPLVHVVLWYHVGSKNELPDQTGFAHLFEHMMFQGSEHVGKTEHFTHIQRVGGTVNATTGQDRTNYFQTLPANYLELALWLEADRMRALSVSDENYDNQRAVVKEERSQRYDNAPYGLWFLKLLELLFEGSPYAWGPIGDMAHLEASPLESVRAFHRRYYVPNNATLVVAGDFDPNEARTMIERWFGEIPPGERIVPPIVNIDPIRGERRASIVESVPAPSVYIGLQTVPVGHPDGRALELLSIILRRGRSSRLQRELTIERQIAQSISAFSSPMESAGMFVVAGIAAQGTTADELEAGIWKVLKEAGTKSVTERELSGALNYIRAAHVASMSRLNGVADALAYNAVLRGDPSLVNALVREYEMVTADDVVRVARTYLDPDRSAVLHYLPRA